MYNSESYISSCLDSILNSNLHRDLYEVIIINDGSSDGGPSIAKGYADNYNNFVYLSQENQGLSAARNSGIINAQGEYIWCVDADDEIVCQTQEVVDILYEYLDLDFLAIQLQKVDANYNPLLIECSQERLPKNVIMTGRDAIIKGYNPSSACALIMRRNFLEENNLHFKLGITHEDVEFTYRAMAKSPKIIFTNLTPYLYFRRGDTMSTPKDKERLLKYLIDDTDVAVSFRLLAYEYKKSDPELHNKIFLRSQSVIFGLVLQLFNNRKMWRPLGISEAILNNLKENGLYPLRGPFDSWRKTLFSKFLNIESLIV